MKKIIAVILALALVASFPVFASADGEKTDRRGCFEFTELFVSRLDELAYNTGMDFDLNISKPLYPYASDDGTVLFFSASAGTLWLDSGDLSIVGVDMTLRDSSQSEDENLNNVTKCVVAISALECSQQKEDYLKLSSTYFGGPKNAFEVGKEISDQILEAINSGALKEAMETGSDVFVCSGNYDYYVSYIPAAKPDGTEYSYTNILAQSRQ